MYVPVVLIVHILYFKSK